MMSLKLICMKKWKKLLQMNKFIDQLLKIRVTDKTFCSTRYTLPGVIMGRHWTKLGHKHVWWKKLNMMIKMPKNNLKSTFQSNTTNKMLVITCPILWWVILKSPNQIFSKFLKSINMIMSVKISNLSKC